MEEQAQDDLFEVYYSNGMTKTFKSNSVMNTWIRGLSWIVISGMSAEINHIVNDRTMEIYSDFAWDVSFNLKDKTFSTGNPIVYTDQEVCDMLLSYVRYVGTNMLYAQDWYNRNKKHYNGTK